MVLTTMLGHCLIFMTGFPGYLMVLFIEICSVSDAVQKIPKWNFWKFLVNTEGKVVRFWRHDEPMDSVRQEATALVREIILKKRVELWRRSGGHVCECSQWLDWAGTVSVFELRLLSQIWRIHVWCLFPCRMDCPVVYTPHNNHCCIWRIVKPLMFLNTLCGLYFVPSVPKCIL